MEKSDHKRYVWRNADKRDLYGEMQTYEMCATMGKASAGKKGGFRRRQEQSGFCRKWIENRIAQKGIVLIKAFPLYADQAFREECDNGSKK